MSLATDDGSCMICDFRKIMLDHIYGTREAVALTVFKVPATTVNPSINRLLQNPHDIGKWLLRTLLSQNKTTVAMKQKSAKMIRMSDALVKGTHMTCKCGGRGGGGSGGSGGKNYK